jgi:hypothetical protein
MKSMISCGDAARIIGWSNMRLAVLLRKDKSPFPFPVIVIPPEAGKKKWQYGIPARPFAQYMGFTDEELEEKLKEVNQSAS